MTLANLLNFIIIGVLSLGFQGTPHIVVDGNWSYTYAYHIVSSIEPKYYANVNLIKFEDKFVNESNGECCIVGTYSYTDKTITIYDRYEDQEEFVDTLYHEIGHSYWKYVLDDKTREEWSKLYLEANQSNHFISEYASTDPEENFCELFKGYMEVR